MGNRLIVATRNPDKLIELRRILEAGRVPVDVGDLDEYPDMPGVAETGLTFTENALLKARAVAAFTGLPAVADDSGLCADALNGMPGVLSARWSGRHGDDDANLQLVLGQLADIRRSTGARIRLRRGARAAFRRGARGRGRAGWRADHGAAGHERFRLRPDLRPGGRGLTTAEMSPADKDKISHRGRALRALAPIIAALLGS